MTRLPRTTSRADAAAATTHCVPPLVRWMTRRPVRSMPTIRDGEFPTSKPSMGRPPTSPVRKSAGSSAFMASASAGSLTSTISRAPAPMQNAAVVIFSDGIFRLDGGAMFGVVPKVLWEEVKPADELNRVAMDMICLLIRDGAGHVVLVETGAGPKLNDKQKRNFGIDTPPALLDELARRGVTPDQVTLVINTHLHFDHAGGNTYRDGERVVATFPRASYAIQRL